MPVQRNGGGEEARPSEAEAQGQEPGQQQGQPSAPASAAERDADQAQWEKPLPLQRAMPADAADLPRDGSAKSLR